MLTQPAKVFLPLSVLGAVVAVLYSAFTADAAGTPENLLTLLPTVNGYHNGGDLAFGDDGTLFVSVGEGHVAERAQEAMAHVARLLDTLGGVGAERDAAAGDLVVAADVTRSL